MKADITTGLPELPEDYFWRIGDWKNYYYIDSYTLDFGVILCKVEKGIFGRRKVVEIAHEHTTTDPGDIYSTAERMWQVEGVVRKRTAQRDKLRGDYPPKRLETK